MLRIFNFHQECVCFKKSSRNALDEMTQYFDDNEGCWLLGLETFGPWHGRFLHAAPSPHSPFGSLLFPPSGSLPSLYNVFVCSTNSGSVTCHQGLAPCSTAHYCPRTPLLQICVLSPSCRPGPCHKLVRPPSALLLPPTRWPGPLSAQRTMLPLTHYCPLTQRPPPAFGDKDEPKRCLHWLHLLDVDLSSTPTPGGATPTAWFVLSDGCGHVYLAAKSWQWHLFSPTHQFYTSHSSFKISAGPQMCTFGKSLLIREQTKTCTLPSSFILPGKSIYILFNKLSSTTKKEKKKSWLTDLVDSLLKLDSAGWRRLGTVALKEPGCSVKERVFVSIHKVVWE